MLLDGEKLAKLAPELSAVILKQNHIARIYGCIIEKNSHTQSHMAKLQFQLTGVTMLAAVAPGCKFKKGELTLWPVTDSVGKISLQSATDSSFTLASTGSHKYTITPPSAFKADDLAANTDSMKSKIMSPFWWVKPAAKDTNMHFQKIKSDQWDVTLTCLTNKVPLHPGDILVYEQPSNDTVKKRKTS